MDLRSIKKRLEALEEDKIIEIEDLSEYYRDIFGEESEDGTDDERTNN